MTKRRRTKKYRPREVSPSPIVAEVTLGEITEEEIQTLHECATRAVDLLQLGTHEIKAFADVEITLRNLWIYAQRFEEEDDIRMLVVMARGAMLFIYYNTIGRETWFGKTTSKHTELTPEALKVCCQPIQACVDLYFDLARQAERRAELVACQAAAKKLRIGFDAHVYLTDGTEYADSMLNRRGVAYVHGRCASGFFKKDSLGRLVWRMPLTDSQAVIDKATLAYLVDAEPTSHPEEL